MAVGDHVGVGYPTGLAFFQGGYAPVAGDASKTKEGGGKKEDGVVIEPWHAEIFEEEFKKLHEASGIKSKPLEAFIKDYHKILADTNLKRINHKGLRKKLRNFGYRKEEGLALTRLLARGYGTGALPHVARAKRGISSAPRPLSENACQEASMKLSRFQDLADSKLGLKAFKKSNSSEFHQIQEQCFKSCLDALNIPDESDRDRGCSIPLKSVSEVRKDVLLKAVPEGTAIPERITDSNRHGFMQMIEDAISERCTKDYVQDEQEEWRMMMEDECGQNAQQRKNVRQQQNAQQRKNVRQQQEYLSAWWRMWAYVFPVVVLMGICLRYVCVAKCTSPQRERSQSRGGLDLI